MFSVREKFLFAVCAILMLLVCIPSIALAAPPERVTEQAVSAELSWAIPTKRANGDVLHIDEIGGYEIYTECEQQQLEVIVINDPSQTVHVVTGLPGSLCDFAIASYDTDGLYSQWSNTIAVSAMPRVGPEKPVLTFRQKIAALFMRWFNRAS